jgi:uncharacterized protein (TIGR02217 family)
MSDALFPELPGLQWGRTRTALHKTGVRETPSGREFRTRWMSFPRWRYRLSYEVLRETEGLRELQTLVGFFNARGGAAESFLYRDPDDGSVERQHLGVGDGRATQFQLVRTWGGVVEPVQALDGEPRVLVGNEPQRPEGFSVGPTGVLSFTAPVPVGQPVSWSGRFFWRVRFRQDETEVSQFLQQLWEARRIEFITVKP